MNTQTNDQRDHDLWKQAKKRVSFRRHFAAYLIVNGFLWCLWLFSGARMHSGFPWPLFPMLGWGIGIAFAYYDAFLNPGNDAVSREYEKLKNQSR